MKKENIQKNVTSKLKKISIKTKKYSPEILLALGITGVIGGTVMACIATTKAKNIVNEADELIDDIENACGEHDLKKEEVYVKTGLKLVKIYAPAVTVEALGITSILASHNLLKKRNVALLAAYSTVNNAFGDYRKRVVDKYGKNVDNELLYNVTAKKTDETIVDSDTGEETVVNKAVGVANPFESDYMMWFDENCESYENNHDYNSLFLRSQQALFNNKLQTDGYVFLSDIYEALGRKRTKMSQTVGWIYNPDNEDGDNFIDFGIFETYRETDDGCCKKAILLNFNVDGPILDLI